MKRYVPFLVFCALGLLAVAKSVTELNTQLDQTLRSLRDDRTEANLVFGALDVDDERVIRASISGTYSKKGAQSSIRLRLDDATYEYGDGTSPTTHAKGRLDLDLTQFLPQTQLNMLVPQLDSLLSIMAREWAKRYGNAVSIKVKTLSKQKDESGNWAKITGVASFTVDLARLPEGMSADSVFAKAGSLTIDVSVKEGMALDLTLVTNPGYKAFKKEERGLKEILDRLLARDQALLREIEAAYRRLDQNVAPLVDAPAAAAAGMLGR